MAAVCQPAPAHKLPSSPPLNSTERADSLASFKSMETETVSVPNTERNSVVVHDENDDSDDSLILAIRALRLLENPQAAATEAIQAFDPKANLHPDLVRLLVAASMRHADVAQGLIELGQSQDANLGHLIRTTTSLGQPQRNGGDGNGGGGGGGGVGPTRHAHSLIHEISISSLLSSISETSSRRTAGGDSVSSVSSSGDYAKPTLKRRLSVLSTKKGADASSQPPPGPPPRKEKISLDSIKKICRANLKDTQEAIEALELADLEDDAPRAPGDLGRMAEESLGHETGKFALCLALTLRDPAQRWDAVRCLMDAMADKLRLLLVLRGRFGPDGDVGLPGQDGFGVRDCWVVLSEPERERLALDDGGAWPDRLRRALEAAPRHGAKAREVLAACDKYLEAHAAAAAAASPRSSSDEDGSEWGSRRGSSEEQQQQQQHKDKDKEEQQVAKRHAMSAVSPQEITDRWAFFFDLLDEAAARRCFRELRLLRQLFNAAQAPGGPGRGANLRNRARRAFEMASRADDDVERWLDTKWAITAMKGFMMSKACDRDADGGDVSLERLDRLDNAFCKTFWACLGSGDHKRLAREDGKQWVVDIMTVFEDRRRYDVMFRLRDIMHFMQSNM